MNNKKGFTLLELIFSILIGSIVMLMGITIMKQVFQTHLKQKENIILLNKTENTLDLLEKYFINSPLNTYIVWKCDSKNNDCYNGNTNEYKSLQEVPDDQLDKYPVMEFLYTEPYSIEGKWNDNTNNVNSNINFVDLKQTNKINYATSEYNISIINESFEDVKKIISEYNKYYNNDKDPFDNNDTVILFSGPNGKGDVDNVYNSYGYEDSTHPSQSKKLFRIKNYNVINNKTIANIIPITENSNSTVYEKFYFINNNIAIVPKYNSNTDLYDLYLVNNFRSWKKEHYKDGNYHLIVKNVSDYSFKIKNNNLSIYLCLSSNFVKLKNGHYLNVCKERYIVKN